MIFSDIYTPVFYTCKTDPFKALTVDNVWAFIAVVILLTCTFDLMLTGPSSCLGLGELYCMMTKIAADFVSRGQPKHVSYKEKPPVSHTPIPAVTQGSSSSKSSDPIKFSKQTLSVSMTSGPFNICEILKTKSDFIHQRWLPVPDDIKEQFRV